MTRALFSPTSSRPDTQRGVALLVALMFLIVLTMLGLAAMRGTTLEERMAGGNRDYNVALQAAEAALRDGENDLKMTPVMNTALNPAQPLVVGTPRYITTYSFPTTFTTSSCIGAGFCNIANEHVQIYNTATVDWSPTSTTSVGYGTYTGASQISGVTQQPRYILEMMQFTSGNNKGGTNGTNQFYFIRITAKAWGASAQTQVVLQEVFLVPLPTS